MLQLTERFPLSKLWPFVSNAKKFGQFHFIERLQYGPSTNTMIELYVFIDFTFYYMHSDLEAKLK